ncbi:FACT complex subunit SSRP1-A-like isoform X1 [Triticum dicoccoides]|uniref:FACT complex subunit SSRP1-A-like isoform X1 n=1 Tax=Triticum dicoccoides TaxID=85692 RepID=UPI00188FF9D1|nr:FACT complex subunit SSRP1-A-like isoform X1 [Triticum dicoccoides]
MTVGHLANDAVLGGHDGTWETILKYSSEAAVDTYEEIAIIIPRGRRTVELHLSFLRLHGQADDIKIQYSSIIRLFVLPKPNSPHTFAVVTLDPPIRKGRTLYPHIVIQFMTEVIVETDLNLSRDLLAGKYKDKLEESYMGPIHEVFTKVLCGLSGAKVTRPGSYRTCQEPPMLILYEEVEFVGFGSYRREGAGKSDCYLDLLVKRKNGQEHIFRNIQRNEYFNLFNFINGKQLKTMNLGDEQSDEDEDFGSFMGGGGSSTDDDSSGDESESSESGGEKEWRRRFEEKEVEEETRDVPLAQDELARVPCPMTSHTRLLSSGHDGAKETKSR